MDQARDLVRDLTLQGGDGNQTDYVMLGQFRTYSGENFGEESGQKQNLRLQ